MSKPKVCFDCEKLNKKHTGFYEYTFSLAQALVELNKDFDLWLYVPKKYVGVFGYEKVRYFVQKSHHKYFNPRNLIFDVWHSSCQLSWYTPQSLFTKVVLTIHDLNFMYENLDHSIYTKFLAFVRRNVRRASYIVSISKFVQDDILKNADKIAYKTKTPLSFVYNGVNEIEKTITHQKPKYLPDFPFLFTLGTVCKKKNMHVLSSLLIDNDLQLLIAGTIGETDYAEKIISEATRLNVQDRVFILQNISDADKAWYYCNCLAYVHPSLAEGFGLPVIEAMKFGKPVFLSTLTALPEIGKDKAYYFNSFDPENMRATFSQGIEHFNNNDRSEEIINYANTFTWQKAASEYLNIYKKVLHI